MSTNKDHLTPLDQGNPTEPDKTVGVEERKKAFIEDIIKVYEKHNLALSYSDILDEFRVVDLAPWLIEWMKETRTDNERD